MNTLKKILGIVWIVLGPLVLIYLIRIGIAEIAKNPTANTRIQWWVFIIIFIPICFGLALFGYYALKGEYDTGSATPPGDH